MSPRVRRRTRQRRVLTLHHSDGVFYLRLEQVDPHHRRQVLHIHLVHLGVQLHLKQEAAERKQRHDQHQIQVRLISGGLCVIWMYSKVLEDVVGLSNYGTPSLECPIMLCVPASTHRQT